MTGTYDPETLAFYNAEAPNYTSSRPDGVARHLDAFLALLKPGGKILEIGCGAGRDAQYMEELGFVVEPTDGSPSMAALAEARLNRPVQVMRFDELVDIEKYDAVVATASLLHVPREGLPDILQRVWQALKPGGWHVATFKSDGVEGYDEHGRYYNYPSRGYLEAAYQVAGNWSDMAIEEYMGGGYFSKAGPWLKIVVRREI